MQTTWVDGMQLRFDGDRVVVLRSKTASYRPLQEFTVASMGPDMRDRYVHVCAQVQKLRATVPRIIYHTNYCKCELMENEPPDYVCTFHPVVVADFMLHFSRRSRFLKLGINGYDCFIRIREKAMMAEFAEIVMQNTQVFTELNPSARVGPLMDMLFPLLLHAHDAMKKCLQLAAPEPPDGVPSHGAPAALHTSRGGTQPLSKSNISAASPWDRSVSVANQSLRRDEAAALQTSSGSFPRVVDERRRPWTRDPIRLPL